MRPHRITLALLVFLPILLLSPAAEAGLRLATISVKGLICDY